MISINELLKKVYEMWYIRCGLFCNYEENVSMKINSENMSRS